MPESAWIVFFSSKKKVKKKKGYNNNIQNKGYIFTWEKYI